MKVIRFLALVGAFLSGFVITSEAQDDELRKYIVHDVPVETWSTKLWAKLTGQSKPKQVALIAGISKYPKLSAGRQLPEVDVDIDKLVKLFRDSLGFDRILVVKNEDVSQQTLQTILTVHLPAYFKSHTGSRFVFAYSGHGFTNDTRDGFLLTQEAKHIKGDERASIPFSVLRNMLRPVTSTTHHTLALINSCESGSFFPKAFGARPPEMFYEGHWGIVSSRESELSFAYPHDDRKPAGSSFFEAFQEAVAEGKADRSGLDGRRDGYISYFDVAAYMKARVAQLHEGRVTPKIGELAPGSWDGAFVFVTKPDATEVQGREAAKIWKGFGGREFAGQVEHLVVKQAFEANEILGDDGWMAEESLVNRVTTRNKSSPRTALTQHIVIGYTFAPDRGKNSIAAIRRAYSEPQFPGSVHFVVYRDASIDQFLPTTDRPWSIGKGNNRGIDNNNIVSIWLDSAGVMSKKADDGRSWVSFSNTTKAAEDVVEADMVRLSSDLLDEPDCRFNPIQRAWDKQTREQLVAVESVIDQLVQRLKLPKSRHSILALNEIVCRKFAPGPVLNPWVSCMKDRIAAGQSVGGCVGSIGDNSLARSLQ